MTEQFIQRLLSSKHLLQVVADLVELPDKSELFLEVTRNSIVAKEDIELTISDFDVLDNGDLLVDRFTRHNAESDSEDEFELLFLNAVLSNKLNMDEETRVVNVKKGETVFKMNLENNELSAPLRKLLRLIEVNKEIQEFKTYSALTSAIIQLLIESGIHLNSNGVELITRALGRDKRNPHLRGRSDENTKFMRLISAITNSGSATVALAFQDYNKLLESDLFNKQQTSPLDEMF